MEEEDIDIEDNVEDILLEVGYMEVGNSFDYEENMVIEVGHEIVEMNNLITYFYFWRFNVQSLYL